MRSKEYIRLLVEKFLDGRTTNAEERELYAWFRSADVPEEWAELKAMFAWYDAGMPDDETPLAAPSQVVVQHDSGKRRGLWMSIGVATAVAASAALLVTIMKPDDEIPEHVYNIYEGSYIVDNGVRYDHMVYIEDDVEALLARADAIELKANELLAWADMQ